MKIRNTSVLFILSLSLAFTSSIALEIPLSGSVDSSGGGGKIGYVDIDKIFQIYPQTLAAKEDYAKQLKRKREQLSTKEKELSEIKEKLSVLEATLKNMESPSGISGSTASASSPVQPQSFLTLKQDLENKKTEYEELRKQAATDLSVYEKQQSQIILGKIYQALKDLAQEEQISVVVDKNSVLYRDTTIDLTDQLQQHIRGY
jgi:Skp family chaperone for outer membrane proteins